MIQARSVSQLLLQVKSRLQNEFSQCWVRGEIAQLTASANGHLYFSLKDRQAVLASVIWSAQRPLLDFQPAEGMRVLALGNLTVYPPRGQLQFTIEQLIPDGVGQYFLALEQLKQKLLAEGLFEPGRKRPLPFFPTRVGVVTSQEGAVWHDIRTTLERRNPCVRLILSPSPVQGGQATGRLIAALRRLLREKVEVVILARGGGSWEDLMAFNSEPLVRFLSSYPVPVIAAVGHETDISLCDMVADRRAPTPTAAAELVAPERAQLRQELLQRRRQLHTALKAMLVRQREVLLQLSQRPWRLQPERLWERPSLELQRLRQGLREALQGRAQRAREQWHQSVRRLQPATLEAQRRLQVEQLLQLDGRLRRGMVSLLERQRGQLSEQRQLLGTLSPQRVLERGYVLCRDGQGQVVTSIAGRKAGEGLEFCLADGRMSCTVEQVSPYTEDFFRDRHSHL